MNNWKRCPFCGRENTTRFQWVDGYGFEYRICWDCNYHYNNLVKYSFIMPYFKKAKQLIETLNTFISLYSNRNNDYEVVIIRDEKDYCPSDTMDFNLALENFKDEINIKVIKGGAEINPAPKYNLGVSQCCGDIVVLTSPEVYHKSNILKLCDDFFAIDENKYIVFNCKGLKSSNDDFNFEWYQHYQINNKQYHFCSAIRRSDFLKIGGFDERYSGGIAFDDDDFVEKLKVNEIKIISSPIGVVVHQWHEKPRLKMKNYKELHNRNKRLFYAKWG